MGRADSPASAAARDCGINKGGAERRGCGNFACLRPIKVSIFQEVKSMPKAKGSMNASANRILNCVPSQDVEKDWVMSTALESGLLAARTVPASKDLREEWWKIGDQLNTGSCVGWASADSVLRWHLVKANRLAKEELLSVRYIWMAAKETDAFTSRPTTFIESDGTSLKAALDIARKYGVVVDTMLPFATGQLYSEDVSTFYATASSRRISSYFNLGTNPDDWRRWLASSGPILTRLDVDDTWDNATKTKGVLRTYHSDKTRGGHAVALVGFTSTRLIVRNSWGEGWGDKGYAYASEAYAKAAFTEAYGVVL